MSSNHIIRWTIALAVLAPATLAQANVVTAYDNFGPGNDGFQYNTGVSWMNAGTGTGFNYVEQAQRFSPSVSGELDTIYLGIGRVLGFTSLTIRLTNSQGNTPIADGTVLETWTLTSLGSLFDMTVAELTSVNKPTLDSSLNYWIWLESAPGTSVAWGHNVVGDSMFRNQYNTASGFLEWNPGNFATGGAQRIDVMTVIPAPSALAMLGIAGLIGVRRRRHDA